MVQKNRFFSLQPKYKMPVFVLFLRLTLLYELIILDAAGEGLVLIVDLKLLCPKFQAYCCPAHSLGLKHGHIRHDAQL